MNNQSSLVSDLPSILAAADKRETAIQKIFGKEEVLANLCQKVSKEMDFEFVSIQIIRPDENTIEAVYGTEWAGQANHYLEKLPQLRDIQADIAQSCKTEIIAGWDVDERFKDNNKFSRFDEWIYKNFHHKNYIRVFTPLFLIQDDSGNPNLTWLDDFDYKVTKNEINQNWFDRSPVDRLEEDNGQHTIIELDLHDLDSERNQTIVKVIGTVEVGYKKATQPIEVKKAVDLIKLVAQQALDIYSTLLPSVLKDIADNVRTIVKADFTSLYFLTSYNPNLRTRKISSGKIVPYLPEEEMQGNQEQLHYVYEVFSGEHSRFFLQTCRPHKGGLGEQAIQEQKYRFIPDPAQGHDNKTLEKLDPKVFNQGIRAIAAFPLLLDCQQEGVLYIGFKREHEFNENELNLVDLFAKGAVHAIRHAINYQEMRDRTNQLVTLHEVTQSLTQTPDEQTLLDQIAWSTLNILGADIVTIYEYIESKNKFSGKISTAGKLKSPEKLYIKQSKHYIPFKIINEVSELYVDDVSDDSIFQDSVFTKLEEIKSAAALRLKLGKGRQEETVGVMLINYRRHHDFSSNEKRFTEILASSTAIAIDNQRWLSTLKEIDRQIISTLEEKELMKLIVEKAQQITGSDWADLRVLEPLSQELAMKVFFPDKPHHVPRNTSIRIKLGEGITGWVAQEKKAYLTNDTQKDTQYKSIYRDSSSELCVPLLNGNHLIGVLNVESTQTEAFTRRHMQMLEALANRAVIAIQNTERQKHLITMKTTNTIEKWASNFVHRKINNDIAAIHQWAKELLREEKHAENTTILDILVTAEEILKESEDICFRIQPGKKQPIINLGQILQNALERVNNPVKVEINNDLPTELPTVLGNQRQLTDVFANFIENAFAAMPNGGSLFIGAEKINSWIKVWFRDTGIGISRGDLKKIFEPGFCKSPYRVGMGFGLWWAKAYIEEYLDGYLTVESTLEKGSTFTVVLPIDKKPI